jgi:hypothetical protein
LEGHASSCPTPFAASNGHAERAPPEEAAAMEPESDAQPGHGEQAVLPRANEALEDVIRRLRDKLLARRMRGCLGGCLSVFVGLFILTILADADTPSPLGLLPTCMTVLIFVALFTAFEKIASRHTRQMADWLARMEDLRVIGILLEAHESKDKVLRQIAEQALIRLLPRVKATDAGLFSLDQLERMHYLLYGRNAELALAALKALEQIGDGLSAWFVEGLTGLAPQSINFRLSGDRRVREAARECLPAINQRLELKRLSQTLLRPASAPEDPSGILLRPAQGAPEGDPNLLLRPVSPEEDQPSGSA